MGTSTFQIDLLVLPHIKGIYLFYLFVTFILGQKRRDKSSLNSVLSCLKRPKGEIKILVIIVQRSDIYFHRSALTRKSRRGIIYQDA